MVIQLFRFPCKSKMQILWRDSSDPLAYEAACFNVVFNQQRPPHRPLAVIKATCTHDVREAVALATEQNCQIAVRSAGHSIGVWSLHADSLLVDLSGWKEITVHSEARVAEITPALTSQELSQHLIKDHGMMFPVGHCAAIGLGGFMLQGGIGWNSRNWGRASELLRAVEVVTAQGELLHCNAQQNQELYWAARGAGPAFPGIVTKFHVELMPYPKEGLRSSRYIYPRHLYRPVADWFLSIMPDIHQDIEVVMVAHYRGSDLCFMVNLVAMGSNTIEAEQSLRKAHSTRPTGTIEEWCCQEETFDNLYELQDQAHPASHYYHTDNAFLDNHADIPATVEEAFDLPPGKSLAFWYPMYPRSRHSASDSSLGVVSDHYVSIYATAEDSEDAARCKAWTQQAMAAIRPRAVGAYLGESCDPSAMPGSWFWGERNAQHLMEVRRKWDPKRRLAAAHNWPKDANVAAPVTPCGWLGGECTAQYPMDSQGAVCSYA